MSADPGRLMLGVLYLLVLMLVLVVAVRPQLTRERSGKLLAFVVLFLLPGFALQAGGLAHLERSKSTEFCLSCHVMEEHGRSLLVDDPEFIAAVHAQNNYVPRDKACYTCHTDYTMYGDFTAKLRGLRHVLVYYGGRTPEKLELYSPYQNRECMPCHGDSRRFLEEPSHTDTDTTLLAMRAGRLSCMESGCHDVVHDTDLLGEVEFWSPRTQGARVPAGEESEP